MSVFRYSPGPKVVDGLNAVPIHLDQVEAAMVFDGAPKTAQCTAEMQFTVGPTAGYPYFDLRQTISTATLDGAAVSVADLAHHDFGGGTDAELRILERFLVAGTSHTLALTYTLDKPDAPNSRGVVWDAGSARLSFDFHLSDLNPSRYLESWLPSNLLFDHFPVEVEVEIVNSGHAHTLKSNGTVTDLGAKHWRVEFPAHFAPCSHLLLIEATDRIDTHSSVAALGGGANVTLELMKRSSDSGVNLATVATTLGGYLADFHSNVGAYMHGNRYVGYLSSSGPWHSMEYDGGTTSTLSALKHEAYHCWWARGMVPARGEDGWLDEAWTSYNTRSSGPTASPLDMTDPPVAMWTNNPFKRKTHGDSYVHGADVFEGIAADIGIASLKSHMAGIYQDREDRRYTTPEIEAELVRRSSELQIVNYFDRFVYGASNPELGTSPDLFIRDNTDDTGATPYPGVFWKSPDVWVRNDDDGGTTPQDPEFGQDNWLHARVRNRGTATAHSFLVGFKVNIWAGTQFVYPGDWFPLTAAVVGFDLGPNESQIVKARWPEEDIPPEGSHGCLLAMAYSAHDAPAPGKHVWEHNNLAQRNLTVVDLVANEWAEIVVAIGSRYTWRTEFHTLELVRPPRWPELEAVITHRRVEAVEGLFRSYELHRAARRIERRPVFDLPAPREIRLHACRAALRPAKGSRLVMDQGRRYRDYLGPTAATLVRDPAFPRGIRFDAGHRAAFPVALGPGDRRHVKLRLKAPADARAGDCLMVDLVQRDADRRAIGGISVQINITEGRRGKS